MPFGMEKLEWLGFLMMKNFLEDIFIRFDRMYERDRQTHTHLQTQTPHDGTDYTCIASCGKKIVKKRLWQLTSNSQLTVCPSLHSLKFLQKLGIDMNNIFAD